MGRNDGGDHHDLQTEAETLDSRQGYQQPFALQPPKAPTPKANMEEEKVAARAQAPRAVLAPPQFGIDHS